MKIKKFFMTVLPLVVIMAWSVGAAPACEEKGFSDVKTDHWAYKEIYGLAGQGVISGYPDATFKPDKIVSRAEFAKMMVLALKLPAKKPNSPSFNDITRESWAYPFAETAKPYLTGYRTAAGDYFRPESPAVREDMAVALVKALGYEEDAVNGNSPGFADSESISPNLRKYVAIAVSRGLMHGDRGENGTARSFRPQDPLKRSEAAVLLSKLAAGTGDEIKVTYGPGATPPPRDQQEELSCDEAPQVSGEVRDGKVILTWQSAGDCDFHGYKVVVSKHNPHPAYPRDGYLYYITEKGRTYAVIDNEEPYKNGDFGKYLTSGERYYFSITAVYRDKKVAGNAVALVFP